jgi:hypothetical protein
MDLRNRRKAYAREMAARQAHEHISKYERLKQVKDTAKRQASKFTRNVTRTISRKQPEPSTGEELQVSSFHSVVYLWSNVPGEHPARPVTLLLPAMRNFTKEHHVHVVFISVALAGCVF